MDEIMFERAESLIEDLKAPRGVPELMLKAMQIILLDRIADSLADIEGHLDIIQAQT